MQSLEIDVVRIVGDNVIAEIAMALGESAEDVLAALKRGKGVIVRSDEGNAG